MMNFRSLLLGTSLTALLAGTGIAQAQEAEDETRALETVVVTSQRIEQNLQDVPISVTAISGDALQDRSIESFEQLQFVTPGISFVGGIADRTSSTFIRGIGTSVIASGIEGSVAIVVDGVVYGREGAGLLDFNDLQRVEVLRGPQGTLFGKNASAGVVSFVTKNPTDELSGSFNASYGSFNEVNLSGAVSGPIIDGVSARVSGFYNTRDGFINNANPAAPDRELGDRNEFGFRAKVAIDVGSEGELILSADYANRDANQAPITLLQSSPGVPGTGFFGTGIPLIPNTLGAFGIEPGVNSDAILSDGAHISEAESYGGYAQLSLPIGNHDFVSLSAFRGWDVFDNNDADLIPEPFLLVNNGDIRQRQFSQEFRISSPQDGRLRYQGGLFFFYQDIEDNQTQIGTFGTSTLATIISAGTGGFLSPEEALAQVVLMLPAPAAVPLGVTFGTDLVSETEEINIAGFGQAEFDVTDKLTLIGGLRLLYSDIDGTADIQVSPGSIAVGFGSVAATPTPLAAGVDDFAAVWRLGFTYDFNENANLFGTFTRGYKSCGLDSNQAAQETSPGAGDFFVVQPEEPNQFELGVRSQWLDGRVTANFTGFYTLVNDFQAQTLVPTTTGLAVFAVSNAGQVETAGFEAELNIVPVEGLTLSNSVAFARATFDEFDQAPCFSLQSVGPNDCIDADGDGAGDFQDLAGTQIGQSPDWTFNSQIRYDFEEIYGFRPYVQVGAQFRSSTISGNDGNPNTVIDDIFLVDFQLGTTLLEDRASITLYGRNITQEDFQASIFPQPFDDGGLGQFPIFESESVYGVRLGYNF